MDHLTETRYFITESEAIKFLTSVLLCGLIGLEREYRSKSAGLKTMIMIGLGSTLFTILSVRIGHDSADRIAANIVTGIGFLGAGVIFKEENRVKGLTTACVIWIVAAIGMAVGSGYMYQAYGVTAFVMIALLLFPLVENTIERRFTKRNYRIVKKLVTGHVSSYETVFKAHKLKPTQGKHELAHGLITGNWTAVGKPENHKQFVDDMLKDESIIEFDF